MSKEHLFTRSEICARVGLSDDVLAYWIVQGLIVPVETETGRGKHKRFRFHQINLAALLNELRGFGANIDSLRGLAAKLNDAFAFAETLSSEYNVLATIQEYWGMRLRVVDGMIDGHWRNLGYVYRPWEEVREFYLKEGYGGVPIPAEIVEAVERLDWDAAADPIFTYMMLGQVPEKKLHDETGGQHWCFWRDASGNWETRSEAPEQVTSSISVNIDRLFERVWLPSAEANV